MTSRRHVPDTLDSRAVYALCLVISLLTASLTPSVALSLPPNAAPGEGAVVEPDAPDPSRQEAAADDDESALDRSRQCLTISRRVGGPSAPGAPQSLLDRPPASLRSPEAPSPPWPSPSLGPICQTQPQREAPEQRPRQREGVVRESSPFVPRLQGPGDEEVMNTGRHAWGVAMLGAGGLAAGTGLLLLRANAPDDCTRSGCQEQNNARLNLGAGLLLGGVFAGGLGLYILVSESRHTGPRIITTTPLRGQRVESDATQWRVGLEPTPGGALIQSRVDF